MTSKEIISAWREVANNYALNPETRKTSILLYQAELERQKHCDTCRDGTVNGFYHNDCPMCVRRLIY